MEHSPEMCLQGARELEEFSSNPYSSLVLLAWPISKLRTLLQPEQGLKQSASRVCSEELPEGTVSEEWTEWDTDRVCSSPKLHYIYLMTYYMCLYSVCIKYMYIYISECISAYLSGRGKM